jgi:phospholipase/carboxylesterase
MMGRFIRGERGGVKAWAGLILLAFGLGASASAQEEANSMKDGTLAGRLSADPSVSPDGAAFPPGLHQLDIGAGSAPTLFVPAGLDLERPAPLVVLLHGAGGAPGNILPLMQAEAEARKFLVLAPQSQGRTWDVILGEYGPDVVALDRALEIVFEAQAVGADRIAVAGFSDGASYALSLGLANGDLFGDVLAFSPGFMAPAVLTGQPRIFMSHGVDDTVLPIDRCSRRIAQRLREGGYDVEYREFDGPHVVPPEMVEAALARFLGGG